MRIVAYFILVVLGLVLFALIYGGAVLTTGSVLAGTLLLVSAVGAASAVIWVIWALKKVIR